MYVYHIRTYQYECRKKRMFILSTARYKFLSGAQLRAPAIPSVIAFHEVGIVGGWFDLLAPHLPWKFHPLNRCTPCVMKLYVCTYVYNFIYACKMICILWMKNKLLTSNNRYKLITAFLWGRLNSYINIYIYSCN